MRRSKNTGQPKNEVKKITIRRLPKKTSFLVHYPDGRKVETTYVEILGNATLHLDPRTKEPTMRTDASISLGHAEGTCTVCGGGTDDHHAHA